MDSKQAMALVAILVVIAAGVYLTKGAQDMGIGWKPDAANSGAQSNAVVPGEPTCIRYDLKDGVWVCSAIGTP